MRSQIIFGGIFLAVSVGVFMGRRSIDTQPQPAYYACDVQVEQTGELTHPPIYELVVIGQGIYEVSIKTEGATLFHDIAMGAVSRVFPPSPTAPICINVKKLKGDRPSITIREAKP